MEKCIHMKQRKVKEKNQQNFKEFMIRITIGNIKGNA